MAAIDFGNGISEKLGLPPCGNCTKLLHRVVEITPVQICGVVRCLDWMQACGPGTHFRELFTKLPVLYRQLDTVRQRYPSLAKSKRPVANAAERPRQEPPAHQLLNLLVTVQQFDESNVSAEGPDSKSVVDRHHGLAWEVI